MNIGDVVYNDDVEGVVSSIVNGYVGIDVFCHPDLVYERIDSLIVAHCIHSSPGLCGDEGCIRCVTIALDCDRRKND